MPSPSILPMIFALGLPIIGYGFVFKNWWLARRRCRGVAVRYHRVGRRTARPSPRAEVHDDRHSRSPAGRRRSSRRTTATRTPGHETNLGVTNAKLGFWMFLASEALFFGAFISTYFLYRGRDTLYKGPTPKELYDIPFTSCTSFILLMSSLTMVLALAAIQRGDHRRFRIWILATALFGLTFIGGQVFEFTELLPRGPDLNVEPVRLDVLHPHRPARRPRHRRHRLVAVAVRPFVAGQARRPSSPKRSRSPASTGTSSTSSGSSSSLPSTSCRRTDGHSGATHD